MTTQTRSALDEAFVRELARAGVRAPLFAWWDEHARALPWRNGQTTPWGVLVCEVMSQQTQMSRVVPYWQAWMSQWPTARALAGAPKADVIQAWGRLGYPRRALRLQECARVVASEYDDELPRGYSELEPEAGGVLVYARAAELWPDRAQLDRCIASLDEDGLIEILPGHALRLPQ